MSNPQRPARRSTAYTHAAYTRCAGTAIEATPDTAEMTEIRAAMEAARRERQSVQETLTSIDAYHARSLALYRQPRFGALALDGWLIADVIDSIGEPPIVEDEEDPAFTDYIVRALDAIMSARIRRALSEQSQRFLPALIAENDIEGAVLLANNAYMTLMSSAATPLMVQAMVSGLAAYYDELPDEE
ncbi:MAG: hypothetical protein ACK5S9_01575 [Roseiflexaceae bacterium]|jgi:hypothetical protein